MKNLQTAYDKIRTYFSKPGADFAVSRSEGMCRYRVVDEDGVTRKCAVGVLIPDERYGSDMEGGAVQDVLDEAFGHEGYDADFLVFCERAQTAHDSEAFGGKSVPAFIRGLDELARQYGLKVPVS